MANTNIRDTAADTGNDITGDEMIPLVESAGSTGWKHTTPNALKDHALAGLPRDRGNWAASTSYIAGDTVYHAVNAKVYRCRTANSDVTFTASKWDLLSGHYIFFDSTDLENATDITVANEDALVMPGMNQVGAVVSEDITGFGTVFKTEPFTVFEWEIRIDTNPAASTILRWDTTKPTAATNARTAGTAQLTLTDNAKLKTVIWDKSDVRYWWISNDTTGSITVEDRLIRARTFHQ